MRWLARLLQRGPDLSELERRVGELEARELAHDIAWSESKEQISRHLKRVAEIERRSGKGADPISPLTQQLLDIKLQKRGA